jgi:GNAT superfamily N-acetyltransferase
MRSREGGEAVFVVRSYEPKDRPAVRRICFETALMGEPASAFFGDDEIFADALTAYFTDREPESCFVAQSAGAVVGYLTGAKSAARAAGVFAARIAVPLFLKAIRRGTFLDRKTAGFLLMAALSAARGEFGSKVPLGDYPATLHINVDGRHRHSGVGSSLMKAYLGYLRSEGVKGVHCATMSEKAGEFFSKEGFGLLYRGRRSYFRQVLGKDVPIYIYGMALAG